MSRLIDRSFSPPARQVESVNQILAHSLPDLCNIPLKAGFFAAVFNDRLALGGLGYTLSVRLLSRQGNDDHLFTPVDERRGSDLM